MTNNLNFLHTTVHLAFSRFAVFPFRDVVFSWLESVFVLYYYNIKYSILLCIGKTVDETGKRENGTTAGRIQESHELK